MHNVVSVDGYIADDNDDIGDCSTVSSNGDTPLTDSGSFQVSRASAAYVKPRWNDIDRWLSVVICSTS